MAVMSKSEAMKRKYFQVDAQSILALGRDSIKDHTTALVELVKNSYDADAEKVEVSIQAASGRKARQIRISDNGAGMTEADVETKWLRIGFSEKKDPENKVSKRGRRKTGEKGIGRLSAARLGSELQLRTCVEGVGFGLEVDWTEFERASQVLHKVPLKVIPKPDFAIPQIRKGKRSKSGTELTISGLSQEWTIDDLERLERELSLLVSPFRKVKDFTIVLTSDIGEFGTHTIVSDMYYGSIVTLHATYDPRLNEVRYRTKIIDESDEVSRTIPIRQLIPRTGRTSGENMALLRCGPVDLTLLFYLQKDDPFEGVSLNRQEIRTFLENNSGVKIYRDDIRVKPYGDSREPEGDWLELGRRFASNPAGAARESFRIPPSRLVGAVFLSRDQNENLIDSTSREGLIKGDAFKDLSELVRRCVQLLETTYHKRFLQEREKERRMYSSIQRVENLGSELNELFQEIQRIKPRILRADGSQDQTFERLEEFTERIPDLQDAIKDIQLQNVIFRGLATLGIASSVFGHETQTLISSLVNAVNLAKKALKKTKPDLVMALEEIDDAITFADRIGSWGEFALARVRRDKRRRKSNDVTAIISNILKELEPPFQGVGIELRRTLAPVTAVTIGMDIEAIIINLLTNAYYACNERGGKRVIAVQLHKKKKDSVPGFEIVVSDSGMGVLKEFESRIWEPLFSTKSDNKKRQVGTGLGLSIVDSVVKDLGGQRKVEKDSELKGARFEIWFPQK